MTEPFSAVVNGAILHCGDTPSVSRWSVGTSSYYEMSGGFWELQRGKMENTAETEAERRDCRRGERGEYCCWTCSGLLCYSEGQSWIPKREGNLVDFEGWVNLENLSRVRNFVESLNLWREYKQCQSITDYLKNINDKVLLYFYSSVEEYKNNLFWSSNAPPIHYHTVEKS